MQHGKVDSAGIYADPPARPASDRGGRKDLCDFRGGDLTSDVVELYYVERDTWSQGPSITTKRGWFGAVLLGQKIYAMGGKTVRPEEEIEQTGDPGKYDIRDSM